MELNGLAVLLLAFMFTGSFGFDMRCTKPKDEGPCKGNERRFYFDRDEQKCKRFQYGGCMGNDNNFVTKKECKETCEQSDNNDDNTAPGGGFHCREPVDPGPCMAAIRKYAYDYKTDTCKSFIYGGCQGNKNNFETKTECEQACATRHEPEVQPPVGGGFHCYKPADSGPCKARMRRFAYDSQSDTCKPFIYGGCQGNQNNFETKSECETACATRHTNEPDYEGGYPTGGFDCQKPKDPGPCRGNERRWYFNTETNRCSPFTYGGCQGNGNNFQTRKECRQQCEQSGGGSVRPPWSFGNYGPDMDGYY